MKRLIIILLCLSATTMMAQGKKGSASDMPFYNKQKIDNALKHQTEYDTVWLPVKVTQHNYFLDTTFLREYEYNESGLLQKWISHHPTGVNEYIYNRTYLMEGEDVLDSVTRYKYDDSGNLTPYWREVYENYQNDFWYAYNDQEWENNQWVTTYRYEAYLLDTLNVRGFRYRERSFTDGVLNYEYYRTLEFDERQNVTKVHYQVDGGNWYEYEYLYDENKVCYENFVYKKQGNNRILLGKTYWEWEEFYGFLNGDVLYFQYGKFPNDPRPNKPATISEYSHIDGVDLFDFKESYLWNIDGNNSAEHTTYFEWGDSLYRRIFSAIYYDEQGNTTGDINMEMYRPYKYGNYHDTSHIAQHTILNYYDGRNRFYRYDFYQIYFDDEHNEGSRDDVFLYTMVVDSFTYVLKKVSIDELFDKSSAELKIAPNPVSGIVTISATAEIAQLQIFDIVGRLVSSQSSENRQVVFDTGVLPKGVYLVQARLKDGGVQTGKVVKQ